MSVETSQNSNQSSGNLGSCLVEGDTEQRARERRIRRRSLAVSIAVQSAIFVTIVLLPLFGRTERIALANYVPIPPYSPYHGDHHPQTPANPRPHNATSLFVLPAQRQCFQITR
jgi:hypothetical protein